MILAASAIVSASGPVSAYWAPAWACGPASVAQHLYRETDTGRAARDAAAEQRRLTGSGYAKPPTKPDKRARRLIRALGDIDAL